MSGYACYGPTPCTFNRRDFYRLAADEKLRGMVTGTGQLKRSRDKIRQREGIRSYIETSSREHYAPTGHFHEKKGYVLETVQKDYYDCGMINASM